MAKRSQSDQRVKTSLAESLAKLPKAEQQAILRSLTDEEAHLLNTGWDFWLRGNQKVPDREEADWIHWLVDAGRGWGKTLVGAHATNDVAASGVTEHIHVIGEDAGDVRDVMVEGITGILRIAPPEFKPNYEPSKRRLTWPNGVTATTFSAREFEDLRGPQCGFFWADEIAKWRYAQAAWDQAMFGLRIGDDPWCVATTTPKPTKLVRDLLDDPLTLHTHGTTYENAANLAKPFMNQVVKRYEGTRLGRQELLAELLEEAAGACWKLDWIERTRIPAKDRETILSSLIRIVVAVDPAVTANEESSETGIVVAGIDRSGHGFCLDDLSGHYTADGWARKAREAFHMWSADRIVAERNNGGDLVEKNIRLVQGPGEFLPVTTVWASRGKYTRAEPIGALWEQKRGHMLGNFGELESQLTTWEPGDKSPDRLDALVWAFTELFFAPTVARDLGALPVN